MATITISRKNGCKAKYSESPLKLPNGEEVLFKIEGLVQPEGVDKEEMVEFLKHVENKIDTAILEKTGSDRLPSGFPHFYFDCPYNDLFDLLVTIFGMTYVEEEQIMLCPGNEKLGFEGSWEEYLQYKKQRNEKILVVNTAGSDDDRSMIKYWEDNTHYGFHVQKYLCPATKELLPRDGLDGAHVDVVGYPKMGKFITPVKLEFNRSHSRTSFYVKAEYLVVAPKKEE